MDRKGKPDRQLSPGASLAASTGDAAELQHTVSGAPIIEKDKHPGRPKTKRWFCAWIGKRKINEPLRLDRKWRHRSALNAGAGNARGEAGASSTVRNLGCSFGRRARWVDGRGPVSVQANGQECGK
jgi:hypothetical protein